MRLQSALLGKGLGCEMKFVLSAMTVSIILVAIPVFASAPPAPVAAAAVAAAPAASPPAPVAVTTAAAAPAVKAPAAAAVPSADDVATATMARELGLAAKHRDGKTVYCRSEAPLGTRLPTLTCYFKEQLPALAKRSQQNQESVATAQRDSLVEPNKH